MSDLLNQKLDLYRSNYEAFISKYGADEFHKVQLWLRDHAAEASQLGHFARIGGIYPRGVDAEIFERLLNSNLRPDAMLQDVDIFFKRTPEETFGLINNHLKNRNKVGDYECLNKIELVLRQTDLATNVANIIERFTWFLNKYYGDVLGGEGLLYSPPVDTSKFIPVSHGYFA